MRKLAALLALALALAVPAATFAVSTSSTSAQSVTVLDSITLTGVPATLAYTSVTGGSTATAPQFSMTYSTSATTGLTLSVAATNLTASSFAIPATADSFSLDGQAPQSPTAAGTALTLDTSTGATNSTKALAASILVPAGQHGGNYTGTLTFTAATNP